MLFIILIDKLAKEDNKIKVQKLKKIKISLMLYNMTYLCLQTLKETAEELNSEIIIVKKYDMFVRKNCECMATVIS